MLKLCCNVLMLTGLIAPSALADPPAVDIHIQQIEEQVATEVDQILAEINERSPRGALLSRERMLHAVLAPVRAGARFKRRLGFFIRKYGAPWVNTLVVSHLIFNLGLPWLALENGMDWLAWGLWFTPTVTTITVLHTRYLFQLRIRYVRKLLGGDVDVHELLARHREVTTALPDLSLDQRAFLALESERLDPSFQGMLKRLRHGSVALKELEKIVLPLLTSRERRALKYYRSFELIYTAALVAVAKRDVEVQRQLQDWFKANPKYSDGAFEALRLQNAVYRSVELAEYDLDGIEVEFKRNRKRFSEATLILLEHKLSHYGSFFRASRLTAFTAGLRAVSGDESSERELAELLNTTQEVQAAFAQLKGLSSAESQRIGLAGLPLPELHPPKRNLCQKALGFFLPTHPNY